MAHSVVYYQAWVRWLLCNDIIPKAITLLKDLLNVLIWQDMPTPSNWLSLPEHTDCEAHVTVNQGQETGAWVDTDTDTETTNQRKKKAKKMGSSRNRTWATRTLSEYFTTKLRSHN